VPQTARGGKEGTFVNVTGFTSPGREEDPRHKTLRCIQTLQPTQRANTFSSWIPMAMVCLDIPKKTIDHGGPELLRMKESFRPSLKDFLPKGR